MKRLILLSALLATGCDLFGDVDGLDRGWDIDRVDMTADISPDMDMTPDIEDESPDTSDMMDVEPDINLDAPVLMIAESAEDLTLTWNAIDGATGYAYCKDDGCTNNEWLSLGQGTEFVDTQISATIATSATCLASQGTLRQAVQLGLKSDIQTEPAKSHTYRVRAVSSGLFGPVSNAVMGKRREFMRVRYEGSADQTQWSDVQVSDQTAPPDGTRRYYRAIIKYSPNGPEYVSDVVEGWRLAVADIVAADSTTCALLSDGDVKCWGDGSFGVLGTGNEMAVGTSLADLPPDSVPLMQRATKLARTHGRHMCALLEDGSVSCWGQNNEGQLGTQSFASVGVNPGEIPAQRVALVGEVSDVVLGDLHSCALMTNKQVHCWGNNQLGQLGLNSDARNIGGFPEDFPLGVVDTSLQADQICAGQEHNCILSSGRVYCWGVNAAGQLGLNDIASRGRTSNRFNDEPSIRIDNIARIECGTSHVCAVDGAGGVLCWGNGINGQLGAGTLNNVGTAQNMMPPTSVTLAHPPVSISPGFGHTCITNTQGQVYCWGNNRDGQLGVASSDTERPSPTMPVMLPAQAKKVSSGRAHTCAILVDGQVYCWGNNFEGALGIGQTTMTTLAIGDEPNEHPTTPVKLW